LEYQGRIMQRAGVGIVILRQGEATCRCDGGVKTKALSQWERGGGKKGLAITARVGGKRMEKASEKGEWMFPVIVKKGKKKRGSRRRPSLRNHATKPAFKATLGERKGAAPGDRYGTGGEEC